MADDERPPEITPWGDREEPDKLFGGFWWVKAERHGGLYLTAEQRKAIPESLQEHSRDGDGIWWEENSAWSLPVMCLLSGRPESSLTEEEQETLYTANQTCQDDYPHEWEQLTGRKLMPGESRTLDGEIEERHGFDDSGPVDRGARFHALVLAADEDEEARTAGRVHMEVVHAGDEGNEFTKIYAVAPEIARELALVENKPENLAAWLAGKGCKLDCEDGPAVVERRADGEIRETWYRDGHWHRTDGPALVERAADGSTLFEDYFLEGGRVAKEDVLFPDREKFDALVAAAEKGETAAVNRLLQSGANIHGCEDAPLRAAALHGHGETVRALVVAGAKVGAWDEMALRCMVHRGDTETVTFLLEKGAHIFAIEEKVYEDIERQGGSEMTKILREAEAARIGERGDASRGEMMGAVMGGFMTHEDAAHMTVSYKTPEGDAVTRIYALSEELAREDRKLPFHEFLTGRELNKFLQNRDCRLDCSTGPAVVEHSTDGSTYEEYWRDGKMHRADGPAQIERFDDGEVIRENYYLNGERVARELFEKRAEAESLKPRSPHDERPPGTTPWGDKEKPDQLVAGFWLVNASHHAGLYLTEEQRKAIPDSLKAHSTGGTGIWWEWSEENGAWSLPVMCLLSGRPETSLSEEKQMCLYFADQACRDKYPREWETLTGRKLMPGESQALEAEIKERHGFDDSGPLDRGTRFRPLVLAADDDEQARNAGRVHMQVVHAGDEGNEFTKTYAVAPAIAREIALAESKPENLAAWLASNGCKLDCEDAPAVVERRGDGEIRETWYRDGHWHRTDGPALVECAADGSRLFEDYFLEGRRVAKEAVVFPERGKFDALLAAAGKGETPEVNRLLQSGAPIHGCEDAPLRAAALHGHVETVRALVVAGAKVDSWDGTALRCMIHRGDTESVQFLLEKGANVFLMEDKVVEEIERQGRGEMAKVLRDAQAVRMAAIQDDKRRGVDHGKKSGKQDGEPTDAQAKDAEAEPLKSQSEAHEPHRDRAQSTVAATELTVHTLLEDPWLVLDHPLPEGADPQLLKAARAAAVVCRYEAEDLIAHDPQHPHARDLKKIDAIFTDIRHRLGEPELEGIKLEPEMEKTLNELEKTWKPEPQKQHDRER